MSVVLLSGLVALPFGVCRCTEVAHKGIGVRGIPTGILWAVTIEPVPITSADISKEIYWADAILVVEALAYTPQHRHHELNTHIWHTSSDYQRASS